MIGLLWVLCCTGAFFSFLGSGLHIFLTPRFLNHGLLRPVLWFLHGVALFTVVGVYAYALDLTLALTLWISFAIAAGFLAVASIRQGDRVIAEVKETATQCHTKLPYLLVLLAVVAIALAPAIRDGSSTTPYRAGIDHVGYSVPANTLRLGETRSDVERALQRVTGTPDLDAAVERVVTPMSLNRQIDGEFLVGGLRRTYSQVVAGITLLSRQDSVWRVSFALPGLSLLSLMAVAAFSLRMLFGLSRGWSTAGAAVVGLNCNLLNTWFEGAYGQAWVAPFALVLAILLSNRSAVVLPDGGDEAARRPVRRVAVIGLFFAAIVPAYADVAVVIVLVAALTALILLLIRVARRRSTVVAGACRHTLEFGTGLILGAGLVLPYTIEFLEYAPTRYGSASAGGFSQPQWATPAEVVGLWDMYTSTIHAVVPRNGTSLVLVWMLSVIVLALFGLAVRSLGWIERSVASAGVAFIALVYYRSRYMEQSSNYQYFKAYTYLLPILVVLLFAGALRDRASGWARTSIHGAMGLVVVLGSATGAHYVGRFGAQARHVSDSVLALERDPAAQTMLSRVALVLTNPQDLNMKMGTYMAAAVVPVNWANRRPDTAVSVFAGLPVVVAFIDGDEDACLPCIRENYATDVLLDRPGLILLSTGLRLAEVTDPATGYFNSDRLHLGLKTRSKSALAELFPLSVTPTGPAG